MTRQSCFLITAALLAVGLVVGGAGENYPLLEMFLELCAIAAAVAFVFYRTPEQLTRLSRAAVALMICVALLPLLQLIPLPPAVWQALPGRAVVTPIDAALGLSVWRPITMDPEGTIRAVVSLIPAFVVFFACLRLHTPEREKLFTLIAAFALVNALLGIAQLASGGSMTPYPSAHIGFPLGLFVNRNHNAVLLLLSMPLLATVAARRMRASDSKGTYLAAVLALLTIVAVVVIGTTSRMALILLPLALGGSLALLFLRQSVNRVALPALIVVGVLAGGISWIGGLNKNLARFSSIHDGRFDYWQDVSWALHNYGLAGTGFGTFVPVYKTAESLSSVSPAVLNHAHNDFIEIILEGGIPAIVLLAAFFLVIAAAALRLAKDRFDIDRASLSLAAALGVVIVLLFSLVDYPLRMPALSCVFAVLCACLLPTSVMPARDSDRSSRAPARARPQSRWARLAVASGGALFAGTLVLQAGISQAQLFGGRAKAATSWAPWSTAAHQAAADEAIASSQLPQARAEAIKALRLSPINPAALRTVAMAEALNGSAESSQRLMQIAVVLGWRDPFTQLWAIGASQQTREPEKAVQRAEALFQQELFLPSAIELLLRDAPSGPTTQALVSALAGSPEWRAGFIRSAARLPQPYVLKLNQLLLQLSGSGRLVSPTEAKSVLERLLDDGQDVAAQQLWMATHPKMVANGGFEQLSQRNGVDVPSDWDISDEDIAMIAVQAPDSGAHGRALRISIAARSGALLSQRLMLPPGRYTLTYLGRTDSPEGVPLKWTVRCRPDDVEIADAEHRLSGSAGQQRQLTFAVPLQDCPIQRLALGLATDKPSREVWVDNVELTRIVTER